MKWLAFFVYSIIAIISGGVVLEVLIDDAEALEKGASVKAVRAPELIGGTGWLNTDRPLYIKDLKGKVVLLDFWTYCCINCMHVIPDLKRLEAKYPRELVVIGIHSAKFTNERDSDNIRQAILRYGIEHPVVNDSEFRIWRSYGVRSWPTLVLINPEGYVAGVVSGEGNYEVLDNAIGTLIAEFSKKIDKIPVQFALEKYKAPETQLSFPGKVITGTIGSSARLFISDSNHNRIIMTDLDGNVVDIIGSGQAGKADGAFGNANFNKPQGMSLSGKYLYVADTENHLVRRCDLEAKTVKTIAGTGQQAKGFDGGGEALQTPLNSPWDLIVIKNKIYIAMAGPHQIWTMDIEGNNVKPYAGSGQEGRIDGTLMKSALAQPSGITTDGKQLFIADSEVSSIRSVDLDENGQVKTVVGLDLFEFGDKDGKDREVRLQHPLGVLYHKGKLYVADTYNHKIKIVDPGKRTSETFLGSGTPGDNDGVSPRFYEPGGLAIYGNKLYVADTNNHAIRVADLSTKFIQTLTIKGLGADAEEEAGFPVETVTLSSRSIRAGGKGNLVVNLLFPPSYKLAEGAPFEYEIGPCDNNIIKFAESDRNKTTDNPELPITIPFVASDENGSCQLKMRLMFNVCKEDTGVCLIRSLKLQIPVQIIKVELLEKVPSKFAQAFSKLDDKNQRIFVEYKINP